MGQDATGATQDAKASAAAAPASVTPRTYSEEEVTAIRKEMQGHKDRGIAEKEKWLNAGIMQIRQHESTIAQLTAERDGLMAKAEGGPDIVAINKKLREERSALERERAEFNMDKLAHEEEKARVNEFKRQEKIKEIATEYKIKPEQILELNPNTEEDMRKFAKVLAAAGGTQAPPPASVSGSTTSPAFRTNAERIEEAKKKK